MTFIFDPADRAERFGVTAYGHEPEDDARMIARIRNRLSLLRVGRTDSIEHVAGDTYRVTFTHGEPNLHVIGRLSADGFGCDVRGGRSVTVRIPPAWLPAVTPAKVIPFPTMAAYLLAVADEEAA